HFGTMNGLPARWTRLSTAVFTIRIPRPVDIIASIGKSASGPYITTHMDRPTEHRSVGLEFRAEKK
ncbi:MAG: hypothetical protein VW835_16020, partial [Rickettsiales bacterium]